MTDRTLPAETRIGHIHLKVSNLERAIVFYRDLLGFDLLMNYGSAAFLFAGGYHHQIGLNTWESADGSPPPSRATGLYHFAINEEWGTKSTLRMIGPPEKRWVMRRSGATA